MTSSPYRPPSKLIVEQQSAAVWCYLRKVISCGVCDQRMWYLWAKEIIFGKFSLQFLPKVPRGCEWLNTRCCGSCDLRMWATTALACAAKVGQLAVGGVWGNWEIRVWSDNYGSWQPFKVAPAANIEDSERISRENLFQYFLYSRRE